MGGTVLNTTVSEKNLALTISADMKEAVWNWSIEMKPNVWII